MITSLADKPKDVPAPGPLAVVFPRDERAPVLWPAFWTAIEKEALATPGWQVYKRVDGISEDYIRLRSRVQAGKIGGLFFPYKPLDLVQTPLIRDPLVRRVAMCYENTLPDTSNLTMDSVDFYAKALRHLSAEGRQRVCWITPRHKGDRGDFVAQTIFIQAAIHGLETSTDLMIYAPFETPWEVKGVGATLAALLRSPKPPDALVITDDNFLLPAAEGMVAAGIRVPDDMVVVTHCNFPLRLAAPFPVARVGYSAASLLTAAAAELRRGAGVPRTDRLLKATVESPAAAEAAARRAAG